ncbi:MAG: hypothetical protein ACI8UO_006174 [Verrucomicrobiales bacterium]|jgi:hypothetical protein
MKMNRNESIEVVIGPAGEIEIDAHGFSGSDCEQATAFLEQALGQIGEHNRKPTYYNRRKLTNRQEVQS